MSALLSAHGKQSVREAVAKAVRRLVRGNAAKRAELAGRLGVTVCTVARWADGLGFPSYTMAVRIAPMVGIDPATGRAA